MSGSSSPAASHSVSVVQGSSASAGGGGGRLQPAGAPGPGGEGRLGALRTSLFDLVAQLGLGLDGRVLAQLLDGLRFNGGQGQLWPLRVLTLEARLRRPLKAAGCAVVVADSLPQDARAGGERDLADALCTFPDEEADLLGQLRDFAGCVRLGGSVLLCTRPGHPPGTKLSAAFLHAGLQEVTQVMAGRYLITAGTVKYR
jgi:hypothetical protein